MNFVGLKKESDRAAVIELLRQAADTPAAKPAVAAAMEAPVEGTVVEAPATEQ